MCVNKHLKGLILATLTLLVMDGQTAAGGGSDVVHCGHGAGGAVYTDFDPHGGQDPRQYAPSFPVDFIHLKLDLVFEQLESKSFSGSATYRLRAVRDDVRMLTLDAVDLYIESVRDESGADVKFRHDAEKLFLTFDRPLPADSDSVLVIEYRCVDPIEGMYFAVPDDAYRDRPFVIHTQGETETSRYWFPCLDYPGDRLTTEVVAAVPRDFFALSNGELMEVTQDNKNRRAIYHWKQQIPQVFYLVTLVIGQFDVVSDDWRNVPLTYYVPLGRADDARRTYRRTPEMVEFFSKITGIDYPYEKYAQVNVPLFRFGGMENTTATTMNDRILLDARAAIDNDEDGLISHELAHQWYGDLITCRSWPHIWLNEGFATFLSSLWREEGFGREDYLYEFWQRFQGVAKVDPTNKPGAIVLHRYSDSFEPFFHKGALVYNKGSCVLHMLRHQLGDDSFFKAVQAYTRRFRETLVETDDLRRTFEEITGRNLEQFFDQWTNRPGVPRLQVDYRWDAGEKLVVVDIAQTQPIHDGVPAFRFPLDLCVRSGGEEYRTTVDVSTRQEQFTRRFDEAPDLFSVDPSAGLLMELKVTKPRSMWLTELNEGPTTISRIVAARHLSRWDRPEVLDALADVVRDDKLHWSVPSEAALSLGTLQSRSAMLALIQLLEAGIDEHRTRRAVVEALGRYDDPAAASMLLPVARSDVSYNVEAAATRALGRMHASRERVIPLLVENTEKDSYEDRIRVAAMEALADLNADEGVAPAKKFATYGYHERLRADAIRVLGKLSQARERREGIRSFLLPFLNDVQPWSQEAAFDALSEIGDERSREAIENRLAGAMSMRTRRTAEAALARMMESAPPDYVRSLQQELEILGRQIHRLEEQLDRVEQLVPSGE